MPADDEPNGRAGRKFTASRSDGERGRPGSTGTAFTDAVRCFSRSGVGIKNAGLAAATARGGQFEGARNVGDKEIRENTRSVIAAVGEDGDTVPRYV